MRQVIVEVGGERYKATVLIESENGRSLALDVGEPVRIGRGYLIGGMALLKCDDEEWRDLVTGERVAVEDVPGEEVVAASKPS